MIATIDLNADMGESFGLYQYGEDPNIVSSISSANLACGFHAGDPTVMRESIQLAKRHHVAIGAHFGFRDLVGFGRRFLKVDPTDLKNEVAYQLGALAALAKAENTTVHHVKPHGALYMMGLEDEQVSLAMVEAVLEFDEALMIYTIHDLATDRVAQGKGLRVVPEFFADRPYFADGRVKMFDWSLDEVGTTPDAMGQRVQRLCAEGVVQTTDGKEIAPVCETICVHSDTPGSAQIARAIRDRLQEIQVGIAAPGKESSILSATARTGCDPK